MKAKIGKIEIDGTPQEMAALIGTAGNPPPRTETQRTTTPHKNGSKPTTGRRHRRHHPKMFSSEQVLRAATNPTPQDVAHIIKRTNKRSTPRMRAGLRSMLSFLVKKGLVSRATTNTGTVVYQTKIKG